MFCEGPEEMRIFDAIVEKKPHLNDFEKHYLSLAVWCYVNDRAKFMKIVEDQERPADMFDDFQKMIEEEPAPAPPASSFCLEEIQDVD